MQSPYYPIFLKTGIKEIFCLRKTSCILCLESPNNATRKIHFSHVKTGNLAESRIAHCNLTEKIEHHAIICNHFQNIMYVHLGVGYLH